MKNSDYDLENDDLQDDLLLAEEPKKQSIGEKVKIWIEWNGHKLPGWGLRVMLLFAVFVGGYATAQNHFDKSVEQGFYIKNATKFEEANAEWEELKPSGYDWEPGSGKK